MNEINKFKNQSKYMMVIFSIMGFLMITSLLISNFSPKKTYSFTEDNCPGTIYNGECCTCAGTTFSNGECEAKTQKASNQTAAVALAGNGYECTVDKDSNGKELTTYTCELKPKPSCTTLEAADTIKNCYHYACTEDGWKQQSVEQTTKKVCDNTDGSWGYPPETPSNCMDKKTSCYCYACENDKWVQKKWSMTYPALCTCESNQTANPYDPPKQPDSCGKSSSSTGSSNQTTTSQNVKSFTDKGWECVFNSKTSLYDCTCSGTVDSNNKCVKSNSSECAVVSASTGSVITSADADDVQNSYYTVNVSYSGAGCGGQIISFSASNARTISPSSYRIPSNSTSGTTQFSVYPSSPCDPSVATASLPSNSKNTSAVTILKDWVSYTVCVKNPDYTSFEAADAAGVNYYYSNYGKCSDGVTEAYTKKWVRYGCGGGGGGGSGDPTPTPNYACYLVDHKYVWASSKPANGTEVSSLSDLSKCKDCESGYVLTDDGKCLLPPSDYACYLVNHKYVWASSKPANGVLVSSKTTQSSCNGCETDYTMNNNNNCVKPSTPPSDSPNVPVNPPTGTVAMIIALIVGLVAVVALFWYYKKISKK